MKERRQTAQAQWRPFVQAFVEAYVLGERITSGLRYDHLPPPIANHRPSEVGGKKPCVLLCSPHPDDEALTGTLPLRLLQEKGATVINLAVTLGSNRDRQAARWTELTESCALLGFDCRLLKTSPDFDLKEGEQGRDWLVAVEDVVHLFEELKPDFVFFPHAEDHHPAHVATNFLVQKALSRFTVQRRQAVTAVETEYWRPMAAPNLLVGVSTEDMALMLAATACHRGEIMRNPYHLTMPARLMDNVRRGAELVNGETSAHPGFLFGELYRLSLWQDGCRQALINDNGRYGPDQDLKMFFCC